MVSMVWWQCCVHLYVSALVFWICTGFGFAAWILYSVVGLMSYDICLGVCIRVMGWYT